MRLNGTVVSHEGDAASAAGLRIRLADNAAYSHDPATARSITIVYHGAVPSAFRDGRAILVDGKVKGSDIRRAQRHPEHEMPVEVLLDLRRADAVTDSR